MQIQFVSSLAALKGAVILPVLPEKALTAAGKRLDKETGGAIARALKNSAKFDGKADQTLNVNGFDHKTITHVILWGVGDVAGYAEKDPQHAGGNLSALLNNLGLKEATVVLTDAEKLNKKIDIAAQAAYGALLRSYRFDKYKTKLKPEQKPSLAKLNFLVGNKAKTAKHFADLSAVAKGVFLARDLVTEPPNELYAGSFVKKVQQSIKGLPLKVKVLNEQQMKKLGMHALLAVNAGSDHEAYTLILEYNGLKSKKKSTPLVLVGKGVTFDTGGYCLKPGAGAWPMSDMKFDMGGGAAVVGALEALARRKAKAHVVGLVGLVENLVDEDAYLPGAVLKTMSGQTVEVLNTDAEGRLVLADILWYAQETYKPKTVINIATLTGAIVMALADQYGGLFSNDEALTDKILKAGQAVNERMWHMPVDACLDRHIDTPIADIANLNSGGAGASAGALFVKKFIQPGVKWAHLDIAGMAWSKGGSAVTPAGATGFGVRLFDRYVRENIEGKR